MCDVLLCRPIYVVCLYACLIQRLRLPKFNKHLFVCAKRSCLCSSDLPSLAEVIDKRFHSILYNPHHVLHSTLPKETGSSYGLRRRRHNRELLNKSSRLVQSCFLVRLLYRDTYWLFKTTSFYIHVIFTLYMHFAFCQSSIKLYWSIDWFIFNCTHCHVLLALRFAEIMHKGPSINDVTPRRGQGVQAGVMMCDVGGGG